jgi:hypothetical protein
VSGSQYSVIIIYGNDLTQWLCTADNTQEMHPELQAEIAFGLENSSELSTNEFIGIIEIFLSRSIEWKNPENDIQKRRNSCKKVPNPVNELLANSMKHEIGYTYNAWKLRHEDAFQNALKVLSALEGGSEIQPYRAFWQHQAATSAFLAWNDSNDISFKNAAIKYLRDASVTSRNITWLGKLISQISEIDSQSVESLPLHDCFLEINQLLSEWKIQGSKYDKEVVKVLNNLNDTGGKDSDNFEHGLKMLGRMLGARTHQWSKNEDGTPDGLWVFGSWCAFVFEAKTNENPERKISLGTLRQAATHEQRVRADKLIPDFIPCITVIISYKQSIAEEAHKIENAQKIFHVSHDEIIKVFSDCAESLNKVRSIMPNNPQEIVAEKLLKEYNSKNVSAANIKERLTTTRLKNLSLS